MKNLHSNVAIFCMKCIQHAHNIVNISWFWHYHSGISSKKSIQSRLKLKKKKKKKIKYQIDGFANEYSMSTTIRVLKKTNKKTLL